MLNCFLFQFFCYAGVYIIETDGNTPRLWIHSSCKPLRFIYLKNIVELEMHVDIVPVVSPRNS
jgi:hypothetical protein